jgi:hypothetical protein
MTDEELIRYLLERPQKDRLNIFIKSSVNEHTTYKDAFVLKHKFEEVLSKEVHTHQSENLKPRFDKTMLYDALYFQLQNKATPSEVFQYVQELYNMDTAWLKEAKHTPITEKDRKLIAKEIYKNTDLPTISEIAEKRLSVKEAIVNNKTPSKQVNVVDDYIAISRRIDALETINKERALKEVITDARIEALETKCSDPKKQLALKLKAEGLSQKDISKIVDVNVRTIRRWFKEVEGT